MIQSFHYNHETSSVFQLETFGFLPEGEMQLSFEHFNIQSHDPATRAGFLMHWTESETTARQDIEEALENLQQSDGKCWLDSPGQRDEVIDMSDKADWNINVSHRRERNVFAQYTSKCWTTSPFSRRQLLCFFSTSQWVTSHDAIVFRSQEIKHTIKPGEEGLYSLIFVRC